MDEPKLMRRTGFAFVADIEGCENYGRVSGDNSIGGIVGDNRGSITHCYNYGEIDGGGDIGGIAGWNKEGVIQRCANFGAIGGQNNVGGVTGDNYCETMSDCYNAGAVTGDNSVGGVVGYNCGNLVNCYNIGTVSGKTNAGGICGVDSYIFIKDYGYITNCYFLDTCGASDGVAGMEEDLESDMTIITNVVSLTAEQMKKAESFVGFDFDEVWTISADRNGGFPDFK